MQQGTTSMREREAIAMQVAEVLHTDDIAQIGGGAGFVTDRIREAQVDARAALDALGTAGNDIPVIGPHPREAAIAAAREAVIHLQEALDVEAPEDAVIDTRHALEELVGTIAMLEKAGTGVPVRPGDPAGGRFEKALGLLVTAEHKLMQHERRIDEPMPQVVDPGLVVTDPDTPRIMNDNGGIVPPWMQQHADEPIHTMGNGNGGIVPPWLQQ